MNRATPILDDHRAHLIGLFARDVARLSPGRLLDVGCGDGSFLMLLATLADSVSLEGVDTSDRRLAAARKRRLRVQKARASHLPFEDGAFDWVVIRHVLHHLEDPGPAVSEAWRVASRGVVLAEPMVDLSIPSQRAMSRLDAFTTRLMARSGHIHHPYLDAGRLLALFPGAEPRVELRAYGALTVVPAVEVRSLCLEAAQATRLEGDDADRLRDFEREAAIGGLSYNGSIALFARK